MTLKPDVHTIVQVLREKGIIDYTAKVINKMSGTTVGLVYTLTVNEEPTYALKIDSQQSNFFVEHLYQAYTESALLPKLLYADPSKTFIVYSFISGSQFHN